MKKSKDTLHTGVQSFRQGDLDHASQVFQNHLQQYPEDPQAHLWMGNIHLLDNELRKAKTSFQRASHFGDITQKQQAQHQLHAIQLNHILQRVLIEPPLRSLLFLALICYGLSFFGLQTQHDALRTFAYGIQFLSIFVFLPLFFGWSLFIVGYFVQNSAFHPHRKDLGVLIARTIVGVCLLGFVLSTARFWWIGGSWCLIASIACGFFLVSLCVGWLLQHHGQSLVGEVSPLLLYTLFDQETVFSPEKVMQNNPPPKPNHTKAGIAGEHTAREEKRPHLRDI
ncbi:MAG: hypothetical protein AAGJ35_09980 [Myxococcota bacterium]